MIPQINRKLPPAPLNGLKYSKLSGICVACVDRAGLLAVARTWIEEGAGSKPFHVRTISYLNAYCFNISCRDARYRRLLAATDLVYADGIGVVWAGRFLGGCTLHKLTGADWMDAFCTLAQRQGWRIYILAGAPGIAEKARANLSRKFPRLKILAAWDGFFTQRTEKEILQEIALFEPDVLFVGMGVPLQEKWIASHLHVLPVKICWAVGALFDYVAGAEPRAPAWMRKFALEWLWRMLMDPAGKWKRYLLGIPAFIARVLWMKFARS